jgi:hypothetical protein
VLAGFLVVLLVELAHQLLEDGAHRVVVDAGRREVDVGVEELVDQRAEASALDSVCNWLRNLKLSRMSWTLARSR